MKEASTDLPESKETSTDEGLRGWGAVARQDRWATRLATEIRALAKEAKVDEAEVLRRLESRVIGVCLAPVEAALMGGSSHAQPRSLSGVDELLTREYRQRSGAFMTPPRAARALVGLVGRLEAGPIIDPACGHGELLLASRGRWPKRAILGVEAHGGLAIAAALRLWIDEHWRGVQTPPAKIIVGDGLRRIPAALGGEGEAALVIGNPPFVGEKGRALFFQRLREKHPRLAPIFAARMDLLYLFLARGAELARPGGWNAWLTPPYWYSADGARGLREYLGARLRGSRFVALEQGDLFDASPGADLVLTVLEKPARPGPITSKGAGSWFRGDLAELQASRPEEWRAVDGNLLKPAGWYPFTPSEVSRWRAVVRERGTGLGELLRDHQGFVSGADRVTRRHFPPLVEGEVELGEPIFLAEGLPLPERWLDAPRGLVRPLLRGREVTPNRVIREISSGGWALYIDGEAGQEYSEALFERLLGPFRPVLERRREVRQGRMPWFRLHWPRDREAMTGPKLVVPRRAQRPCFALDLSGSVVSSDCTFLTAPEGVANRERYLCALMLLLNSEDTDRYLRYFGKRKGSLLEFYSTPLRRIVVPARREAGRLVLDEEIFDEAQRRDFFHRVEAMLDAS